VKRCSVCHRCRPRTKDHFYRRAASRDGLDYRCKKCVRKIATSTYEADPARGIARTKKYKSDHPEKVKKWVAQARPRINERQGLAQQKHKYQKQ
jgi:hypothetical protein